MRNILRRRFPKYEFMTIQTANSYEDKLKKLQDEGWELAGSVAVHYHGSPTNREFMYIPFKRRIK